MAIQQSINSLLGTAQSAMAIKKVVEGQEAQVEEQKKTRAEAEATKNLVQEQQAREERLNKANIAASYNAELNPLLEEQEKARLVVEGGPRATYAAKQAYETATERLRQYKENPANVVMQKYASGEIKDFASYTEELAKVHQQEFAENLARLKEGNNK